MENHDALIGQRIYDFRTKRDVNQNELANALNIHASVLNRIEKGSRPIRGLELKALAEYFQISADFFLGITDSHTPTEKSKPPAQKNTGDVSPEQLLVNIYRQLDARGRASVADTAKRELLYCQSGIS